MYDLGPATRTLAGLVGGVRDDQLTAPTPCAEYTLGDLVEHVGGLALAFTRAATKSFTPGATHSAGGDAARLPADWRTSISAQLDALAEAWRDPEAWQGMTEAGGVTMPGEIGGGVALNELVVHGWDVAAALGRPYQCDPTTADGALQFAARVMFADDSGRGDAFGPAVAVPPDATKLDRLVALNGRDPVWVS